MQQTGVYIISGPEPEGALEKRVYVGEGDTVLSRLDAHQRDKEFWDEGFVLTTTDDSLNKAHVRYLEARLIAMAEEGGRIEVDNDRRPEPPWLSEADMAAMETFLDEYLLLLPILGVSAFQILDVPTAAPSDGLSDSMAVDTVHSAVLPANVEDPSDYPLLHLKTGKVSATARDEPRGFVVYRGAVGPLATNKMQTGYERLRAQMIDKGFLRAIDGHQYELVRSFTFDSPSAAASVIAGGSLNGRKEWKDGMGRSLREIQEQTTEPTASPREGSWRLRASGHD